MADSDSNGSGNTRKRKMLSSSDSADSSFTPPGGMKYKLRSTTAPDCVFCGNAPPRDGSSSSTVRGPNTSKWGQAHCNRLNFGKVRKIRMGRGLLNKTDTRTAIQEHLIHLLLEPLDSHDGTIVDAPNIVDSDIIKKLRDECSVVDPVLEYMEALLENMKIHFDIEDISERVMPGFNGDYSAMMMSQHKYKSIRPNNLSEASLHQFHKTFRHIVAMCALNRTSELELDHLISNVMCLIQEKEGWQEEFMISKRDETNVEFDICGTQVASETHVLWKYLNARSDDQFLVTSSGTWPLVLSENKSYLSERQKSRSKSAGYYTQRTTSSHKNIAQVIGQCVSIADKSRFETEDYKIVYHVSLMDASELVVTRTHVAKSTLRVINGGCPIPNQSDLDPSYVFEASFHIDYDIRHAFFFVYAPLLILGKLSYICLNPRNCKH